MKIELEKRIIIRLFIVVWAAAITVGLSSVKEKERKNVPKPRPELPTEPLKLNFDDVDHQIDTILVKYGVVLKQVRKKKFSLEESSFTRLERQIWIPKDTPMIMILSSFHELCQKYGGRAIASENIKDGAVVIHLEIERNIIESIIFRQFTERKNNAKKNSNVRR